MRRQVWVVLAFLCALAGCDKHTGPPVTVLPPPGGTNADVAAQLERGNRLFASRDWTGAEQAFRQTITLDPGLAEGHYNLAVTLDRMGKQADAKKHYMEAANLAPGNKVIWDSPPLRGQRGSYGHDTGKKSYQDPSYKGF